MLLSQAPDLRRMSLVLLVKSFLVWTFTLTVCWLVVGFPVVVLMVTFGSLVAIALQAVLPMSAVVLVAGGILSANVLAILAGSAVLTLKGIHPHQISWLRWLNGKANPEHATVYAACPLTCDRTL
ncbi:MAG: hypothetical protein ACFCU8_14420 [Thermosynechococcaceae cyanobacterium]